MKEFNVFDIKWKVRFWWFKWCNLWLKRLKSSNYTCKLNGYIRWPLFILLQTVQRERVEGKEKHRKQEWHGLADVDVVSFDVVYVGDSSFYCISLHQTRYCVTIFVYCLILTINEPR